MTLTSWVFVVAFFNLYHADCLKWNNPPSIFDTVHYQKLVSHQYIAWSDCADVQAGLALYWWQMLIIFGVGRIRVKPTLDLCFTLCLYVAFLFLWGPHLLMVSFKVYKAISPKMIFRKVITKYKIRCINIPLNIDLFIFDQILHQQIIAHDWYKLSE